MKYNQITTGRFIERPNRFIAYVEIPGISVREKVHVKNTGRCRELLIPGAKVILEKSSNPNRSTAYDLVAVYKGERLINMDSQAPNKVAAEWLETGELLSDITAIKPEKTWGKSRFDFYVELNSSGDFKNVSCEGSEAAEPDHLTEAAENICAGINGAFIEVKGVTLEENGVVRFPDAPSDRAVKHVEELIKAKAAGYQAFILFVIQMKDVLYFMPNWETHPAFGEALLRARAAGVELIAVDCSVEPDGLQIGERVPVYLTETE